MTALQLLRGRFPELAKMTVASRRVHTRRPYGSIGSAAISASQTESQSRTRVGADLKPIPVLGALTGSLIIWPANQVEFVPAPARPLEAAETKLDDKRNFLQLIRALTWGLNVRPVARDLLQGP
ncbi:CMGC/SRPK protein kinase [Colletotrichum sojae]|uniref:CMGC/SRPK protein kinase n=1 Tax=Colletotrichum sojae TaxID=2175907 RepID=A0A8H6MNJ7_9PEZI|nr:CMGC/SRPK protein kinase [Colletotrichum sojae]